MSQTQVAALLDIKDRQIAKRLFEIIAGDQGEIDAERFKSAIVSLVRGDDQAKLKFVFDLYTRTATGRSAAPTCRPWSKPSSTTTTSRSRRASARS
jgi:hypothetical protein